MGVFNLSHDHITTCDMGELIPVATYEVLPGDVIRHRSSALLRTTALEAPVMHPVYIRMHHFFVPNRILDDNWEDFITTKNGRDANAPTITLASGSVAERMGMEVVAGDTVLAYPIRAYNLIWNEWYRDQDLQSAVSLDQQTVLRCAWGRDYFTKARPNAQQGSAVTIPVDFTSQNLPLQSVGLTGSNVAGAGARYTGDNAPAWPNTTGYVLYGDNDTNNGPYVTLGSNNGNIDVNQLRRSLYLQLQAEQRERYGSRYRDLLKQFGAPASDARLDRPELIGKISKPISFTEVVATAEGTGVDVGDLYGHGMGIAAQRRPIRRVIPEHGWILTLASIIPRTQYSNMVPKQFLRDQPPDWWFPESEIEGPQAIAQREVYAQAASPTDTWGYTGRHDDYRQIFSYTSGEMRTTLNDWHYAREFSSYPALNGDFVEATPTNRVYQNTANQPCRLIVNHRIMAQRPVSQTPMV